MASKPLIVAAVATALLVVTIWADASMNRTYYVDVKDGDAWRTVAQGGDVDEYQRAYPFVSDTAVTIRNGTPIDMRLRVDNDYFWAVSATFVVSASGLILAEGAIESPARSAGVTEFSVNSSRVVSTPIYGEKPTPGTGSAQASFEVIIGNTYLYAYFPVEVVS